VSAAAASWTLDDRYAVHLDQPREAGGQAAFAAAGPRGKLLAIAVRRALPPRQRALEALIAAPVQGVLNPVAHGPGPSARNPAEQDYYVLCEAPPGPALSAAPRAWSEQELISALLLSAAAALGRLRAAGVTHRAIRPDNVFQAAPGEPVVLGQAWAAPPAALQPALFEPPYSAMCLPAARGEGSTADDVYALGVLMVVLALGGTRLAGLSPDEIVRVKLDLGSFDALTIDARLPAPIADLARGMLAEDPEHRPTPALLADPASARARRLAARAPRRAAAPVRIGAAAAWTARAAAHAIATEPEPGLAALQNGAIDTWLRRSLGDPMLAGRLDEALRGRAGDPSPADDALAVMRAVAVLDPLAPLAWRGRNLWPDGFGTALAAAEADQPTAEVLAELAGSEAIGLWAALRAERSDPVELRAEARRLRGLVSAGRPGSRRAPDTRRLLYALNPLLPCASTLLGGRCVARLPDLLAALEASAASDAAGAGPVIDGDIVAFLSARAERGPEAEMAARALRGGADAALAELDLLASLQARWGGAVPALARRIVRDPDRLLSTWHGTERRARLAAELTRLAESGQLGPMLALLRDRSARAEDEAGARAAAQRLAEIDAALAALESNDPVLRAAARGLGQEVAAGLGLAALVAVLVAGLLG